MKNTLTVSILLLAGSANAQYRATVPAFPGANNPIISLPKSMPNPLSGPLAGTLIQLPTPTVTPTLNVAAVSMPLIGISMPVAPVPVAPITARRENVANPMNSVMPTIKVHFADPAQNQGEKKDGGIGQNDELDDFDRIFDGKSPARPGRRINIPEAEMEQELGL